MGIILTLKNLGRRKRHKPQRDGQAPPPAKDAPNGPRPRTGDQR